MKGKWWQMKGNESESSQPTRHNNPIHSQSQMKIPYIINWRKSISLPEMFIGEEGGLLITSTHCIYRNKMNKTNHWFCLIQFFSRPKISLMFGLSFSVTTAGKRYGILCCWLCCGCCCTVDLLPICCRWWLCGQSCGRSTLTTTTTTATTTTTSSTTTRVDKSGDSSWT